MKRVSGDGQGRPRLPVLDAESRATPGCVMKEDVVMTQPSNPVVQFWEVPSCIGEEVKLRRLHKRESSDRGGSERQYRNGERPG